MDPYLLTIKHIFQKNNAENVDISLNDFFTNGNSFPRFVALLYKIDKIPGVIDSKNKFQAGNNNTKALSFLGQKSPFFSSYSMDFYDQKNQISLIQLILTKIYFNTNKTSFLKKANDFISSKGLKISGFSEFVDGNGFMKLLNVVSNGSIPTEVSTFDEEKMIEQLVHYLNSLNICVIIDRTAFVPMNYDLLMYQALIIMDYNISDNTHFQISTEPKESQTITKSASIGLGSSSENSKSSPDFDPNKSIDIKEMHPYFSTNNIDKNENNISLNEIHQNNEISQSSDIDESLSIESSEILNLPKNSYLNIVNNLMEVHNMHGIMSFSEFEQGKILPKLVELLLKEKVPNVVDDPSGQDQMMNNMNTLYFINQKNPDFNPRNFNLTKENDLKDLIRILIKKYMLTNDCINEMKENTNKILNKYKRTVNNLNKDWDDGTNFIALLSFISDGKISFPPNEKIDDIIKLKEMFVLANCPVILEKDALFGNTDELVIMYQIKLIFNEIYTKNIPIPKEESTNQEKETKSSENDNNNPKENEYVYEKNSSPILRLFNLIGFKIGVRFNSLEDIIDGTKIHLFVAHLIGIPSIPGIKESPNSKSENFDAVFNYLSDNNRVLRYSLFDFDEKSNASILLFATTLLEQYFLKESKKRIIKRASEILDEEILFTEIKQVFLFGKGFYKILGNKDIPNNNYYDEESLMQAFQKADVPFIMDDESLTNVNNDYICFQLQLIYNKLIDPSEFEKEKQELKKKKELFWHKIEMDINENQSDNLNETDMSNFLSKIGIKKKSSELNINVENYNKSDEKIEYKSLEEITKFLNEHDIINAIEKEKKEIMERRNKELNNIKDKLKPVVSDQMKNDETKVSVNIDSYMEYNYDLYSYKSGIDESENIDSLVDKNLMPLFQNSLNDVINKKTSAKDDKKEKFKYNNDKPLKSYRILEYKGEKWVYNQMVWPNFIKDNNLSKDDILYWVLFTPCPTTDINIENDQIYNFIKAITMSKTLDAQIDNSIYVELLYGRNVKDIQNNFRLNIIPCQNEKIVFVQLRYPTIFKGNPVIDIMQSILTLQANYVISLYPKLNIDETLHIINTSFNQAVHSEYFNNKFVGMSFLIKNAPFSLEQNMKELIHHPDFAKILDKKLQNENEFFKNLQKSFEFVLANINWIDINDPETYHNFLEIMINFCQIHFTDQNSIIKTTKYFSSIKEIDQINDQIKMNNFVYKITKQLLNEEPNISKPLFKYLDNNIIYDKKVFQEFITSNLINKDKGSLFTILVIATIPSDFNFISRIISKTMEIDKSKETFSKAEIKYCGTVESIANSFNIKLKGKPTKSHVAFIFVNNGNNSEKAKFFKESLASICDLTITISDFDESFVQDNFKGGSYLIDKSKKLTNILNLKFEKQNKEFHHIFVIKDYLDNKLYKDKIAEKISTNYEKYYLNIFNDKSNVKFVTKILDYLPNDEKNIHQYEENQLSKINSFNCDSFERRIFSNIYKTIDANDQTKKTIYCIENVNKIIRNVDVYYNNADIKDIINDIKGRFMILHNELDNKHNLLDILSELENKIIPYFSQERGKECIQKIKTKGFKWDEICQEIIDFITKSVTYIDNDYLQYLKESCRNQIEETIYNEVDSFCSEADINGSLKIYIYKDLCLSFEKEIADCITKIESTFIKTQVYKPKTTELTQEEIEQNAVKYILSVKESIKQLTVEILCDDDLEREIPLDY